MQIELARDWRRWAPCVAGDCAAADTIEEKAAVCSACHGENGVPIDKSIPVLFGQNEGYIYIELRDMKKGARKNDQMAPIVENMSRDDMLALAAYFAAKPWPNLQQPRASAEDAKHFDSMALRRHLPRPAIRPAMSALARSRASPARASIISPRHCSIFATARERTTIG